MAVSRSANYLALVRIISDQPEQIQDGCVIHSREALLNFLMDEWRKEEN